MKLRSTSLETKFDVGTKEGQNQLGDCPKHDKRFLLGEASLYEEKRLYFVSQQMEAATG